MTNVLSRLESRKQVFILRRSAGFATFIALLRAEPRNVSSTLLPLALDRLLLFAEEGMTASPTNTSNSDNGADWSTCVHALNALRLILIDAALGAEIDVYVPRATMLAVRGWHLQWGVRNSSMMLFSSVVQRAVDNDKRSEASSSGSTAVTSLCVSQL